MLSSPTDHRCSSVNTSAGMGFCLDRPRTASPTSAAQKICMPNVRSSRTRRMHKYNAYQSEEYKPVVDLQSSNVSPHQFFKQVKDTYP